MLGCKDFLSKGKPARIKPMVKISLCVRNDGKGRGESGMRGQCSDWRLIRKDVDIKAVKPGIFRSAPGIISVALPI